MLWAITKSDKLKKTKVQRNLVGARSLEGLGTLGRLGFEGLCCVVLVFASLFPLSLPLNYCCGYDYLWFRFFINSILAYVHVPHIYYLIISLNWYFVNWRSKRSGVFYTHFEHSL